MGSVGTITPRLGIAAINDERPGLGEGVNGGCNVAEVRMLFERKPLPVVTDRSRWICQSKNLLWIERTNRASVSVNPIIHQFLHDAQEAM